MTTKNKYYNKVFDKNSRYVLERLGLEQKESSIVAVSDCFAMSSPFAAPIHSGLHLFFGSCPDESSFGYCYSEEHRFTLPDKFDIQDLMRDLKVRRIEDLIGRKVTLYSHQDRMVALTPYQ